MISSLLRTKLYIPPSRNNSVERLELTNRLNAGLNEGRKLSLISAPAGYGKTTIITDWIKKKTLKVGWFSIDKGDNEPQWFFRYLVAALQSTNQELGDGVLEFLHSPQMTDPLAIMTLLINEIALTQAKCILVFDEYHLIENSHIHNSMEFLIENSPPNLAYIIITREDPPFPIGKWRVRNQSRNKEFLV